MPRSDVATNPRRLTIPVQNWDKLLLPPGPTQHGYPWRRPRGRHTGRSETHFGSGARPAESDSLLMVVGVSFKGARDHWSVPELGRLSPLSFWVL